jgi:basic membrane protein A and related proteins
LRRNICATALAVLATSAMLLSACGSKSPGNGNQPGAVTSGNSSGSSGSSGTAAGSYKACMVTDVGGIDDKSFNQSAWAGMQAAQAAGKATVSYVQSKTEADYTTNINNLLGQNCSIIVTVGGLMGTATTNAAKANPNQKFAEVDYPGNGKNMVGLQYNSAQGGFLGGYLAAGYSKTGKVAVYGGLQIPPVTVYMDGYYDGVQYYNTQHHTNVQVLGWNTKTQKGTFAGSFTDQTKGQQLAKNFLQQGVDVIFTAAGAVNNGTAAEVKAENHGVVLWVDTDGCLSAPAYCNNFLSSVTKNVEGSVKDAIVAAATGQFPTADYIGTLANSGTGLAPFHSYDSKVSSTLKSELTQVEQDIINGKITVDSPSQPKAGG